MQRLLLTLLLGAVAALAVDAEARISDEEWKMKKAKFYEFWQEGSLDNKLNGINLLAACDHPEAVELLLKLLKTRNPKAAMLYAKHRELLSKIDKMYESRDAGNGMVRLSTSDQQQISKWQTELKQVSDELSQVTMIPIRCAQALGQTKDPEAMALIHKAASDSKWEIRLYVMQALAMAKQESSKPFVRKAIDDRDPKVASAAIDAARALGDKEAIDPIIAAMSGKRTPWQLQVSAAYALASFGDLKAVGPLVEMMQGTDGRVASDIDDALHQLTGFSHGGDAELWKRWYAGVKDRLAAAVERQKAAQAKAKKKGGTVSFYGITTNSKSICFVIDISGSMRMKAGAPPDPTKGAGATTGGNGAASNPASDPDYPRGPNTTKMDIAKYELSKAVKALPKDAKFNIVYFSTDVGVYSKSMISATDGAKKKTLRWIEQTMKPTRMTNIFDALDRALNLAGNKLKTNYEKGVDTIFFLTDGAPSHGRLTDPNKIIEELTMTNRMRKVKIHVIGIGKPEEINKPFLEKLAQLNGGSFVHRE